MHGNMIKKERKSQFKGKKEWSKNGVPFSPANVLAFAGRKRKLSIFPFIQLHKKLWVSLQFPVEGSQN